MEENSGGTAIVPAAEAEVVSRELLDGIGFISPIAQPAVLRAAFAEKQRLYAAILDESDYIYTAAVVENGRTFQRVYSSRKDADKVAGTYGTEVRASPKKSGIVKLAAALGISAKRKQVKGLPEDASAVYSYVVYEATHAKTGRTEEGIGWCDNKERGGRLSIHDMIATADTRAYNRAVLRLAGFGDVSADEIVGSDESPQQQVETVAPTVTKKLAALPASTADEVTIAQRAWAEEASKRSDGFLAAAQQGNKQARELRARARRGNEASARQMGVMGYVWEGLAQESGGEVFTVEPSTVHPDDITAARIAMGDPAKPGWDASGTGSVVEENRALGEKPVTRAQAAAAVPAPGIATAAPKSMPDPSVETITKGQAKALSDLLMSVHGTAEVAKAWLREHADVERSPLVRMNQYEALVKTLEKLKAEKSAVKEA